MKKFNLNNQTKISSGFTTPESYFEDFSSLMMEKVSTLEVKKPPVFTLNRVIYAAAAVLILALSIPFFMQESTLTVEQIDNDSVENYISFNSNVSSYDIINLMDSKNLEAMQVDMNLENQTVEDILTSNPNFENYMIE